MAPKTVLITGCSEGGIGAAVAQALARRGHHVYATARDVSKIPGELRGARANVTVLALDVRSAASVRAAAEAVAAADRGRGLDVLLNNAGVGYTMPLLDADVARAQAVFDVNVWGLLRAVQAFAPLLVARRGRVVNLNTCGAVVNTPWIASYTASKAAAKNMTDVLRLELAPFGVAVVSVMAGVVDSAFHANEPAFALPPSSRYADIEDIIAGWARGESKPAGCSAAEFAEMLVEDIVGDGGNAVVFRGPHAGSIRYLSNAPRFINDAAMSYGQGLHELSTKLNSKEDK
ncbi:oxidoreductase [Xylariomycetidae sp. FL0641]|nr:oxidoreductase [Xylariomycetidae sp. FL0641]